MKKILDLIMILCCMAASLFCFTSCSDDLDIQQEYPFTVEAMPVADKIVSGQTVEIIWKLPRKVIFPERFILSAISSLTGTDC